MSSPLADLLRDNQPRVMGILNITPDSFSDGGQFLKPEAALERALRMQEEGADLIDVGAESTRPGASPVAADAELARLLPVLPLLLSRLRVPLSVDTSKYEVMSRVLELGVRIINDVRAMRTDERIPRLLADSHAGVILMHSRGEPDRMQEDTRYADVAGEVIAALRNVRDQAVAAGVSRDDIVLDPGIGFGKSAEDNWRLVRALPRLRAELQQPVMIGLSRKSFLSRTPGFPAGSVQAPMAAAHLAALQNGARILRAHDIIEARQVIRVFEMTSERENS